MTTPSYVSQVEFDAYCENGQIPSDATQRASALAAAERAVENYCQRKFTVAPDTATARPYPASGSEVLSIHDCTAVTSVVFNGTTLDPTSYQLEPTGLDWSGLDGPYEQIRRLRNVWYVIIPGQTTITVTAKWGWTATPAEVPEVVKQLGRLHILRRRMGLDDAEYREILAGLNGLRRAEAFGIA